MEQNKPRCPHCGAPQVRPDVRFCNYCGQPLAVTPQRRAPARHGFASWLVPVAVTLAVMLILLGAAVIWLPKLRHATSTEPPEPSATPVRVDTSTPGGPTPVPALTLRISTGGDLLNVLSGPGPDYPPIGAVGDGFVLDVLGRSDVGNWYLVRLPSGLEGWVNGQQVTLQGSQDSVPIAQFEPAPTATPTETPTAGPPMFTLDYRGCVAPGMSLGQVKGQVFDRNGSVIVGAEIEVLVEGQTNIIPPGHSNSEGWYEFNIKPGQHVRFRRITINGQNVPFTPTGLEVQGKAGCYQRVDIREQ